MDGHGTDRERKEIKRVLDRISDREMRDTVKEAIKELFHEQAQDFGWWSIRALSVLIFGGIALIALYLGGWPK